jgi:LysR family transcriptional regulator, regulator of abg operon
MPKLDPKRLIDLLMISEHGSYTRAAAARGVSQPALSNSVAALERTLGIKVLERNRRGAELTDFGRLLASHAAALDSVLARASEEVELKKLGMEGSLAIGASPVACVDIVPDAISQLKRETPNIAIRIDERPDDELIKALRFGEIDFMISPTGLLTDPPDIACEILLQDGFEIIMRRTHRWARRRSIALSELRGVQWVMPNAHSTIWRQIEALFAAENEPWPTNCIATNSITALKSLIMRDDFVSIASGKLVKHERDAGHIVCIALRKSHFVREICLRQRRGAKLTPIAQRFGAIVRAQQTSRWK